MGIYEDHLRKIQYEGKPRKCPPHNVPVPDDFHPFDNIKNMPQEGVCATYCTKNSECKRGLKCCGKYQMCMDPKTGATAGPTCDRVETDYPSRDVKHVLTGIDRDWAWYGLLHPDFYTGDYNG